MIKKISLFLFATLMVLGFDLRVEAINIDNYAYCIYNFTVSSDSSLFVTNFYDDTKDFYIYYDDAEKRVLFYNHTNDKNTYYMNTGASGTMFVQTSLYSNIAPSDIYNSTDKTAVCNSLSIKVDSAGSPYVCSPSTCKSEEGYSEPYMVSKLVKKVNIVGAEAPTTEINTCSDETIAKIWSSIENSTEYKSTKDYYSAQRTKITSFDYVGSYNTKVASGMSSTEALSAVKNEAMKMATDFYPTESSYNSYISNALPSKGYFKDYDCSYDAETDNPQKFKQYYNYITTTHSYLVNAATTYYKKALLTLQTAGTITSDEYTKATGVADKDKESANDKYVKEAAARTTKYVEKMRNYDIGNVDSSCEALLTPEAVEFLNKIFNYFKLIAPILVIVLGTVDFSQAVLSSDKDNLSKATNKFIKRCIAAIALFFIPLILSILLTAFGSTNPLCGLSMIILNL